MTEGESKRDPHGRLYSAFDKHWVTREVGAGDVVLLDRDEVSASSGKRIHRLIVKRADV